MSLAIRAARLDDLALVFTLVRELADYEKLSAGVDATADGLAAALFADDPRVFCDIAEWGGEPAGFALWFQHYSTFRGRFGIYLEDLFVRPAFRHHGIGTALMQRLAQRCVTSGHARFEWMVLDWNTPSIAFYRSIGAELLGEWKLCRLSGSALHTFAREGGAS